MLYQVLCQCFTQYMWISYQIKVWTLDGCLSQRRISALARSPIMERLKQEPDLEPSLLNPARRLGRAAGISWRLRLHILRVLHLALAGAGRWVATPECSIFFVLSSYYMFFFFHALLLCSFLMNCDPLFAQFSYCSYRTAEM